MFNFWLILRKGISVLKISLQAAMKNRKKQQLQLHKCFIIANFEQKVSEQ